MKGFVLHISDTTNWAPTELLLSWGGATSEDGDISKRIDDEWLIVGRYNDMSKEYEDEDIELVNSLLAGFVSYVIFWSGNGLLQRLLDAIPRDSTVVLDNDFGSIFMVERGTNLQIDPGIRAPVRVSPTP